MCCVKRTGNASATANPAMIITLYNSTQTASQIRELRRALDDHKVPFSAIKHLPEHDPPEALQIIAGDTGK